MWLLSMCPDVQGIYSTFHHEKKICLSPLLSSNPNSLTPLTPLSPNPQPFLLFSELLFITVWRLKEILLWGVRLARGDTGVATWIAWGERGANDGKTGLASGLWYLLDVIDGEQRGRRREGKKKGRRGSPILTYTWILFYCLKEMTFQYSFHWSMGCLVALQTAFAIVYWCVWVFVCHGNDTKIKLKQSWIKVDQIKWVLFFVNSISNFSRLI